MSETEARWVAVACPIADLIRGSEHVFPSASKTDPDGMYGKPEVYTEWSARYPSGREVPVLREHRWPGLHQGDADAGPCEHYVPTTEPTAPEDHAADEEHADV